MRSNETQAGLVAHLPQSLIQDVRMLKVVVREEIKLIQEVPDINATERVHSRKRKNVWEAVHDGLAAIFTLLKDTTHLSSSRAFSGVYQLTLSTLSYSSKLLIGMGI